MLENRKAVINYTILTPINCYFSASNVGIKVKKSFVELRKDHGSLAA